VQEDYNEKVAEHYAAFRPPLHRLILENLLTDGERFESGLDIGCGTGYSSIVLADHCDQVVGLDPSKSMIDRAEEHPSITYVHGNEVKLKDFDSNSFDVVTFAGSLYYAKNQLLYQELLRTLTPNSAIFVYDFEVLLHEPLAQLELKQASVESDYQFIVDLSDWPQFATEAAHAETIELPLSSEDLSHVLLADSNLYTLIADKLGHEQLHEKLVEHFESEARTHSLRATLYYSRLIKR
jgi:SAM-dependent methyltransferase